MAKTTVCRPMARGLLLRRILQDSPPIHAPTEEDRHPAVGPALEKHGHRAPHDVGGNYDEVFAAGEGGGTEVSRNTDRTLGPWPIVQWLSKNGGGFTVEDDQGYNFSFPTRAEAESFRSICFAFVEEMAKREKSLVSGFREGLFS